VSDPTVLVRVIRSGLEESVHLGHVAVSNADGDVVAWAGDPERHVFARSSMKPLQASVSLSAATADDLPDAEVAVMCASHNGEPAHVEAVRRLLDRAGLTVDRLRCPPDWPLDPDAAASAGSRRRELHNCSGKHAGKLLAAARAGWDLESYLHPGHPLQRRILDAVQVATDQERVRVGVDGCGAPVHGMPLSRMALLYARIAQPDRLGDLAPHAKRATSAMLAEPYMVAGRDRLDTAVMEVAPTVVVKVGAEGLVCAAAMDRSIGVAVKVADGTPRAAGPALIETLRAIGLLEDHQVDALNAHARPDVLGGGSPVGTVEPAVTLTFA
jgi:L-asparaginase II